MRALVAARLSRVKDDGPNRIELDDEKARAWAEAEGHEVVATSADAGVSGGVSPFKRKTLGPWLDEDGSLIHDYDLIVASSVDRLGRDFRDMCELRDWAEDNGKALVILDPPLSWPPADDDIMTPMVWDMMARFAEWELKTIKKRIANGRAKVRENRAFIGRPPFGFRVIGDRYSRTIEPDPELEPVMREMVRRGLRGDTLLSIAQWLDSLHVKQTPWLPRSVTKLLTNPCLKGEQTDANGNVLHRHTPLITPEVFAELKDAMNRSTRKDSGRIRNGNEVALLTGVIFCDTCGGPMNRLRTSNKRNPDKVYEYYRCKGPDNEPSTCKNMINLDLVDGLVHASFMDFPEEVLAEFPELPTGARGAFAGLEIFERVTIPGNDHSVEIAECEDRLRSLDFDDPKYASKNAALMAERSTLLELPATPATIEERPTGRTVGSVWATMGHDARRRFLLASNVRVLAANKGARMEGDPSKVSAALRTIAA